MKRKILIATSSFANADNLPLRRLIESGYDIIINPYGRKLTKDELLDLLPGVVGIISGLEPLTKDVLEKTDLKVISRCGVGVDNIDLSVASDFNIKVFTTPDGPTMAVAELTVGMMIMLGRKVCQMDQALHAGIWDKQTGFQLYEKNIVVIGFGRIGQKVVELLRPFNPRIIVVDPFNDKSSSDVVYQSLETALPIADIVTLHANSGQEIIGEKEFGLMKHGTYLINAGRGILINHSGLIKALEEGVISGGWIDTFLQEPYHGELCRFPQVILTPHIATYATQCRKAMEMSAVENLLLGLSENI